jgi:hypothetical protein
MKVIHGIFLSNFETDYPKMWRFDPDEWSPHYLFGNLSIHGQTENGGDVPWLCPNILKNLTF